MPAGSEVRISERTPGEASAPKRLRARPRGRARSARLGACAVNQIVPTIDAGGGDDQRAGGRDAGGEHRGQQRAEDEDQLDQHGVERVGGLQQRAVAAQQRRPHRAQHGRGRRDREAGEERAGGEHGRGRAELRQPDDARRAPPRARPRAERARAAAPKRSTSRPWIGAPIPAPAASPPATTPAIANEPVSLAQVEDQRERVDPDREARDQRRRDQRRDVRDAQDLGVALHAAAASLARPHQHRVDHRRGQLPGERVLLAGVEAAEQAAVLGAVAELRARPGRRLFAQRRRAQRGLPRERAEADHDARRRRRARARAPATPSSARAPPAAACWPAARSGPRR